MVDSVVPPCRPPLRPGHPLADQLATLTQRERDILARLSTTNRPVDIARELGLGEPTVRTHIQNARRKLGGIEAFAAARALAEAEGRHQTLPNQPLMIVPRPISLRDLLPFRPKGATGNDLSTTIRLLWIPVLAIAGAVGFGSLAAGAKVVGEFFESLAR